MKKHLIAFFVILFQSSWIWGQAPVVTVYSPQPNATQVLATKNLEITFDLPVKKGISGSITFLLGTVTQEIIDINSPTISITGKQVTIDPTTTFPPGVVLSVHITAGAFLGVSNNQPYLGIPLANTTTWRFTTDGTPPIISQLTPVANATGVAQNTRLQVRFSEPVVKRTGSITIRNGSTILETINVATAPTSVLTLANDSILTISPVTSFPSSAAISVTLAAGTFNDLSGNAFAGNATSLWRFTTVDLTPPTILSGSYVPANSAINIVPTTNLTIQFSEKVVKGTGTILIRNGTTTLETINVATAPAGVVTITSDSVVTINPVNNFPSATRISVSLQAGTFTDLAGNAFSGNAALPWTFQVADVIQPTVFAGSYVPATGSSSISPTVNLSLRFSEKITKGTGLITLRNGNTILETINVATAPAGVVTITSDSILTINPVTDFPSSAQISISLASGTFVDLAGNAFGGNAALPWTFQVADVIPPTVIQYNPAPNATGVLPGAVLQLTFSEPIQKGTGGILAIDQGTTSQAIAVTHSAVSVSGNTVTITPPALLPINSTISIQISPGAFQDLAGNAYAGIATPTAWRFQTLTDNTPPVITRLQPRDDTTQVAANAPLVMVFSEPVKKVAGGTIVLVPSSGGTPISIPVNSPNIIIGGNQNTVVTIVPPQPFPSGSDVYVLIFPNSFSDDLGNPFEGITAATTWNFRIIDTSIPTLVSLTPANGTTGVAPAASLVLTFSEPIKTGSGKLTISQGTGNSVQIIDITDTRQVSVNGNSVVITPPDPLVSGALVTVQIPSSAITDLSGNRFAGISGNTWQFTVADIQPPVLVANGFDPADNALNVASNKILQLTFNEKIKKGNGSVIITTNGVSQTIPMTNAAIVATDNILTINYSTIQTGGFTSGAQVYVLLSYGAVTDLSGNLFPGLSNPTDWNFAITDNTAPVVRRLSPSSGATNISSNTTLLVSFSELVKAGVAPNNRIRIFQVGNATPLEEIAASNTSKVSIRDSIVTILNSPLPVSGLDIYVTIETGAFTDLAGNPFAGILTNTQWRFGLADGQPPIFTILSPANGATNVAVTSPLSITFSEKIKKGSTGKVLLFSRKNASQTIDLADITVTNETALIPHAPFLSSDTLYVLVFPGTFTDLTGNAFPGISDEHTWKFTTQDITPPQLVALKPSNGSQGIALQPKLELTFDETIIKGTSGNITIYQVNTNTVLQTIPVVGSAVANSPILVAGKTASLTLPANLPTATPVAVRIDPGTFTDLSGNAYAGITNTNSWIFTTIDVNAPFITTYSPPRNVNNVPTNTNLTFTFNKEIQKGNGNLTLGVSKQTGSILIPVSSNVVAIDASRLTVVVSLAGFFPNGIPSGATITVTMDAGTFIDIANNNPFAGIPISDPWQFTVNDIIPPDIAVLSPADNATGVPVSTTLTLTFTEPVKAGAGKIYIYQQGSTAPLLTLNANQGTGLSGTTVSYPISLPAETNLYVQIDATAFTDLSNLPFAGISSTERWNFSTQDTNPPQIITYAPANKAINVPVTQELVLTFNESVKKGADGDITVNTGGIIQKIRIQDAVFEADKTVRFPRTFDFVSGQPVFVLIPTGLITDLSGNPFAGITNADQWSFTAIDNIKPLVTTLTPPKGATAVLPNTVLSLTFSKPMKLGSGTIFISQQGSSQTISVPSTGILFSNNDRTITLPNKTFPAGPVTVFIPPGTFTDKTGNAYDGINDWTFTVADVIVPIVVNTEPARNEVNVPPNVNLLVTFSEPVRKGSGLVTITPQGGPAQNIDVSSSDVIVLGQNGIGTTVSIQIPQSLPSGSTIIVTLPSGSFLDQENNPFNGTQWSFTVADVLVPVLAAVTPLDNSAHVARNTALTLTFSEPIVKGSGKISVFINGSENAFDVQTLTPSGRSVTLTLPTPFPTNAAVYVLITKGAFKDASGLSFEGITDQNTWNFTIEDYVPPLLTDFAPKNPPDVAVNANVVLTFSEPVKAGTGTLLIGSQNIPVTDSRVRINGNIVTIDPADFASNSTVAITIPEGSFTDLAGNPADEKRWSFRVIDIEAPFVVRFSPTDDSTQVSTNALLRMVLSKPIRKNTGLISVSVNGITRSIDVNSTAVTIAADQKTVTIHPHTTPQQSAFPSGAVVFVTMPTGVFVDLSSNSNPFGGISSPTTWNFMVADILPPQVVSLTPANQAVNIGQTDDLVIVFNETVRISNTLATISITQTTGTGEPIGITDARVTISGNTVRIRHTKPFESEATINVVVPASAFEDLSGNVLATPIIWNFQTVDVIKPIAAQVSPTRGQSNVATTSPLVITFSEKIKKGAGKIILTETGSQSGGRTQTLSVNSDSVQLSLSRQQVTILHKPFLSGATVSVIILNEAFLDDSGNQFDGFPTPESWSFTVSDIVLPYIVSKNPEDESIGIAPTTELIINFSEPMKRGRLSEGLITFSYIDPATNTSTGQILNASTDVDNVKINLNTVTIRPRQAFPSGVRVTVMISNGAFTDLEGNKFGMEDVTAWNFNIADISNPLLVSKSPASGSLGVSQNTNLSLTFNEFVKAGTGFIHIFRTDNINPILTIDASDRSRVVIDANQAQTVTIRPNIILPSGTSLYVTIEPGAFTDLSGNDYLGIAINGWTFTVSDVVAPQLVSLLPTDNARNASPNTTLELTISEAVKPVVKKEIYVFVNGIARDTILATNVQLSLNNTRIRIPVRSFSSEDNVYIRFADSTFTDVTGNKLSGFNNNTAWNFSIADVNPPLATAFKPVNGAVYVKRADTLTLTFNEPMKRGIGFVVLNETGPGINTSITIQVADTNVIKISSRTIRIIPPELLPYQSDISVQIPAGTFTDLSGNAYQGINPDAVATDKVWRFRTLPAPDFSAPRIVSLSPKDDAIDIPLNQNLTITFNEPIRKGTGLITISGSNIAPIDMATASSNVVQIKDNTLTINPPQGLPANTNLSIQLEPGVVTDTARNAFTGIINNEDWNFLTADPSDTIPPMITLLDPLDGSSGVAVSTNFRLLFSERVRLGTGNIVIDDNGQKRTIPVSSSQVRILSNQVIINPDVDLASGANVNIQIPDAAFTDLAGNRFILRVNEAGKIITKQGIPDPQDWNFSTVNTKDRIAPTLTALSPGQNAVIAPSTLKLILSFSEPIRKYEGVISIRKGTTIFSIDVNSTSVKIDSLNQRVTITVTAGFTAGVLIEVFIPSGTFVDAEGNSFAGFSEANPWKFRIRDTEAPQIASLFPARNSGNIAKNSHFLVEFNEPVQIRDQTQSIRIYSNTGSSLLMPLISLNDASQVSIVNNTLIIHPQTDIPTPQSATDSVYIQIEADGLADLSGNAFEGIAGKNWQFSMGSFIDNIPPKLTINGFSPSSDLRNVDNETVLKLTFNEPIQAGMGKIYIFIDGKPVTLDITDSQISIHANTLTLTPTTVFPYLARVFVQIDKGAITDRAGNAYEGITDAAEWNFIIEQNPPVTIQISSAIRTVADTAQYALLVADISQRFPGIEAVLYYRGISDADTAQWKEMPLTLEGLSYQAILGRQILDLCPIGLEYYFELRFDKQMNISPERTNHEYIYHYYTHHGLVFPSLSAGKDVSSYQIVSVPLELERNDISDVFVDDLQLYDTKKWRFFRYEPSLLRSVEYQRGLSSIEPGNGYWLISKNQAALDTLDTGSGFTLASFNIKRDNPFRIALKPGWNQIGNPYNFTVSWKDILKANPELDTLTEFYTYIGEYKNSLVLPRFRGGFIFAEKEMQLRIPTTYNRTLKGGRTTQETAPTFTNGAFWEINFTASAPHTHFQLAGLGMHPLAQTGKDPYDRISLPRLPEYTDISFEHPEYFIHSFAKDIVPVQDAYTWEFTLSSTSSENITLTWARQLPVLTDKHWFLFDVQQNKAIDLTRQSSYVVRAGQSSVFRMYYGSATYIDEHMKPVFGSLGSIFPNPFAQTTTIPFALAKSAASYQVQLEIYSITGVKVATLVEGLYPDGLHEVVWDGKGTNGIRVASGMYLCTLKVSGSTGKSVYHKKVIIQ